MELYVQVDGPRNSDGRWKFLGCAELHRTDSPSGAVLGALSVCPVGLCRGGRLPRGDRAGVSGKSRGLRLTGESYNRDEEGRP